MPQLKTNDNLTVVVKDKTGEIGCLRFNHLYPPFDKPAVRRAVLSAINQKDVITAFAGDGGSDIVHHHLGAVMRHGERDSAADARAGPGDDGDMMLQQRHRFPPLLVL